MGILKKFSLQFGKPEGIFGSIAGNLMASTGVEKNKWTISLLNIQRTDNVLEIGFGPGIATKLISKLIHGGHYVGIDYSTVMFRQAKKRNIKAIQEGKVTLKLGEVSSISPSELKFDKVLSVNSIIFWKDPVKALKKIRQIMKPNGLIALTMLPYMKGATEETSQKLGDDIARYLKEAGFSQIKTTIKEMNPNAAVCVLGVNE
ncbi:SAM-dependent methyltransferase [Virgibacillus soli]|uniref:class I SAM-dependent methyltransferase n=1 Tax=Lederbergia galactosidilytica TaxID=217031 RepID=UPI00071531EC|nr:SAM-dependent methyltransferase [Virgibacillus soli]MBP1916305.1 ubiquinone/menaquinone biosynthesis C-methylase UbiE [Lederbergia galactosidilytica]